MPTNTRKSIFVLFAIFLLLMAQEANADSAVSEGQALAVPSENQSEQATELSPNDKNAARDRLYPGEEVKVGDPSSKKSMRIWSSRELKNDREPVVIPKAPLVPGVDSLEVTIDGNLNAK